MGKTENYNLLDEDWIPVLYTDGRYCRVGIKTVLREAGKNWKKARGCSPTWWTASWQI
jgi:hypothetical protein